jgi:hypothetical protein
MNQRSNSKIGSIIRNGIVFDIKKWVGGTVNTDSLIESVESFFILLETREIDYVLVGGVALLYYVEGRNTQDLDLIMSLLSLEKIPEIKILSQDLYFIRAEYEELLIDILLTENLLFNKIQTEYVNQQQFFDRNLSIVSVDGLILLKLYALPSLYRQGDFSRVGIYENDIATLLYAYEVDITDLIKTLSDYLSETDLKEIERILNEIQARIDRFRQ